MPDFATWIALSVATYGAGLSTATAVERRRQRKQESSRGIRVTLRTTMARGSPVRGVHAYNAEHRPVEVRRAGLVAANGMTMWHGNPYPPQLPTRLGDGEGVFIEFLDDWLRLIHASTGGEGFVSGAVEDAGGNVYASEPGPPVDMPPAEAPTGTA
jgi:hypothetical protein